MRNATSSGMSEHADTGTLSRRPRQRMKIFALDSFRMPGKRQREKTLQMCPWWKGQLLAAMLTATISVLSGCTALGPDYQSPKAKLPEAWMSPIAHGGEQVGLQNWWAQFEDETLLDLIRAAEADSPNLQRALASIDSARANLGTTRSAHWPSLNGTGRVNRMRQLGGAGGGSIDAASAEGGADSMVATYGTRSAGFDASWELDLFGKSRRNIEAARARLEARVNDWHEARVSLAAEVADTYVQYRGCQLLVEVYRQELTSMEKTDSATRASVAAGFTSPANGFRTRASLAEARSKLEAQQVSCHLLTTALQSLTGVAPPTLTTWLAQSSGHLPRPRAFRVERLPADALRQRPDVAALERGLAASSAEIGAARADLYPSLSLSGEIALTTYSLLSSAIRTWSFGPALTLPLLDGGRRRAAVEGAEASYQSAYADWREGVKKAVREIEEALANLDGAHRRSSKAAEAAAMHQAYYDSVQAQWQEGGRSLLELEEARRSALQAEVERVSLLRDQVQYWIALYKATGGGWSPESIRDEPVPRTSIQRSGSVSG